MCNMSSSCYVVKDSPQPQLPLELGLLKTNSDLQSAQETFSTLTFQCAGKPY